MNDIQEYILLCEHVLDGKPVKPTLEQGYIPIKRSGMMKFDDGKITEMTLSQSVIKQVYWTGPSTNHISTWEIRPDACAWRFYNLNVINKYRYPQSKAMVLGNYFETLCLGGGAYSKTLSVPGKYNDNIMTVDEERILDAVERFKRVVAETGIIIGESNTQVEFKMPVIDPDNPDVKVYFKGIADIISPFYFQDINYDVCVIDLKLAKDRNLEFSNPYKPWEQFSWGDPVKMSTFQGTSYSEGFQMPFLNLVVDYPKENPGWKIVPVKTIISHPDDPEARLRSREMKQGIRQFISQVVEWNEYGWQKSEGVHCIKCPVISCEMKNQIKHI